VVLLLAEALDRPSLRDLALAMALLSPIVAVAFVRYWVLTHDGTGDGHG
jgi:multisubunit Na+/H+ antiporter MnhF subunit